MLPGSPEDAIDCNPGLVMERSPTLSYIPRPEVRMALLERLPMSADFDAFCLDFFPKVYGLFAPGMNRLERTNLLLESVGYQRVWEQLHGDSAPSVAPQPQNPYRGL